MSGGMSSAATRLTYSCPSLPQPKTLALWKQSNAASAPPTSLRPNIDCSFIAISVNLLHPKNETLKTPNAEPFERNVDCLPYAEAGPGSRTAGTNIQGVSMKSSVKAGCRNPD